MKLPELRRTDGDDLASVQESCLHLTLPSCRPTCPLRPPDLTESAGRLTDRSLGQWQIYCTVVPTKHDEGIN